MKLSNEARVGLMVTVGFTIFIVFVALFARINLARSGYNLRIYYGFLNNLSPGAPVKIAGGIKIGRVEEIKQSGERTEVVVWIDKNYTLLKTCKFAIFTTGMIGEKYINVFVPPSITEGEYLRDGDQVYGIDPASFDQMMLTFQSFLQDQNGGQMLAEIFLNSKNFVANLNRIAEDNRGDIRTSVQGTRATILLLSQQVKILMEQLNHITANVANLTDRNKEDIAITMRNLSEITTNLNKIIFRLEKGRGTMGKLLTDEEIYNNIRDASISARDLFKSLKQDPSKLFFRQQQK